MKAERDLQGGNLSSGNGGKMRNGLLAVICLLLLIYGCASGISRQALKQADPTITFQQVQKDPDAYKGKVILLGGQILSTRVQDGETWIEVLQRPLDWRERPSYTDVSHGRFLIRFPDFRDPAVYGPGRQIAIVGEVQGKQISPVGGTAYVFPVLIPREAHLWKVEEAGSGPFINFGIGVGGVFR